MPPHAAPLLARRVHDTLCHGRRRIGLDQEAVAGISAQMIMITAAMLLFAPILARGDIFGQAVVGAVAPVSVSMALSGASSATR